MTKDQFIKKYSERLAEVRKQMETETDETELELLYIEADQLVTYILKLESMN